VSLLITIVAVALGVVYAGLVNRRFGARSRTAWLLILPVAIAYAWVVFTADTTEPGPRAMQAFGLGALVQTAFDGWRAGRERRRRINAAEAAVRDAEEVEVRAADVRAAGELRR
jgi:hypothetical protein